MITPILENERYKLFMQGGMHRWTVSGTSDHYYDYTDDYHQWRGAGVVVDKETGQSTQFNFSNPASRFGNPTADLKSLVLQTEQRNALAEKFALPNQEGNIINFVCKRLLDKVAKCTDPIKTIVIDHIPFAELINAGIMPDSSGQIHLGIPALERDPRTTGSPLPVQS